MTKSLASQAMTVVTAPTEGSTNTLPQEFVTFFDAFRNAFKEACPDETFRATDVMRWGGEYQRLKRADGRKDPDDFSLPSEFFNPYSLGRLLKRYQVTLGIEFVGTYGNRAVYTIAKEKSDAKS